MKQILRQMEPHKWHSLSEMVASGPTYRRGCRLTRMQVSSFMRTLKQQGKAVNKNGRHMDPHWKLLTRDYEGYTSRYDYNYFCTNCNKWIPKKLEQTIRFPENAAGKKQCPFCQHNLRTLPRGSRSRRMYNETHCHRI